VFATGSPSVANSVRGRPVHSCCILLEKLLFAAPHSVSDSPDFSSYILWATGVYSVFVFFLQQVGIQLIILFATSLYYASAFCLRQGCIEHFILLLIDLQSSRFVRNRPVIISQAWFQFLRSTCDRPDFILHVFQWHVCVQTLVLFVTSFCLVQNPVCNKLMFNVYLLFATGPYSVPAVSLIHFYIECAQHVCDRPVFSFCFVCNRPYFSLCKLYSTSLQSAPHSVFIFKLL